MTSGWPAWHLDAAWREHQACEDCGAPDATFGPNPYAYDIDDETGHWMCARCREAAADDI